MKISENTKISQLIKENPECIEAISSINPHFKKLKNPILRRVLAPRVTIKEAAKIGGSSIEEFFNTLKPLGFEYEKKVGVLLPEKEVANTPNLFLDETSPTIRLDVREDLKNNVDPFQKIMTEVSKLKEGGLLLLINTFEPIPLIKILEKKGFESFVRKMNTDLVYTYFRRRTKQESKDPDEKDAIADGEVFKSKMKSVKGMIEIVDVRKMEMPMPMITVLERLAAIDEDDALFVQHHKVPHFLLPELKDRGFNYLIRKENPEEVLILIYKGNK